MNEKDTTLLIRLYTDQPLSVDKLPYTAEFAKIVRKLNSQSVDGVDVHSVYQKLVQLRKSKRLPTKRRRFTPSQADDEL